MKTLYNGKALIVGLEIFSPTDYPNLKVVGCNMTSTEHLPEEEMKQRGIHLISLASPRDEETEAFLSTITGTAEMTLALMLSLARNLKAALRAPYNSRDVYTGHTLRGKTLGLFGGAGRIGQQVRHVAQAFGVKVIVVDKGIGAINDMLRESDIVSLHIPLANNEGFFTREMFQQMRSSAFLINTSRSGIVDKGALLWALENAIIAGAAVDFVDDPDLVKYAQTHDNLILTNHIGGATFEDMQKTEQFILEKVENYLHESL